MFGEDFFNSVRNLYNSGVLSSLKDSRQKCSDQARQPIALEKAIQWQDGKIWPKAAGIRNIYRGIRLPGAMQHLSKSPESFYIRVLVDELAVPSWLAWSKIIILNFLLVPDKEQ